MDYQDGHTSPVRPGVKHHALCAQSHCTVLSLLCNMDLKIKNSLCINLLSLGRLGAVFFILCPFLSTSALTDNMFTAVIRELHLVQALSVHKSLLFYEDLLAQSLCPHLDELVCTSKKYLISQWCAGSRAGSWDTLLLSQGSAILAPQPVLALKLAQHGWVSEHVSVLPVLRYTSAAQKSEHPRVSLTRGHPQNYELFLLLQRRYCSADGVYKRAAFPGFFHGCCCSWPFHSVLSFLPHSFLSVCFFPDYLNLSWKKEYELWQWELLLLA